MALKKGSRGWRGRQRKWGSRKRADDGEGLATKWDYRKGAEVGGEQGSGTAEREQRMERESKEVG